MDNSFYVYFTVTNVEDFTIVLAERFRFNEKNWFCGLVDFQLSRNVKGPLYLCSDILKNNFINTQKHPVIARISKNPPSVILWIWQKVNYKLAEVNIQS